MKVREAIIRFIERSHLLAVFEVDLVTAAYLQHRGIDALLYLVVVSKNRIPS